MRFSGVFLLTLALLQPLGQATASATPGACEEAVIPVTLLQNPTPYSVRGTLCLPAGPEPDVVQLLLHGGTYDREYFDFEYRPAIYSYARHATLAGYATLNLDRIGHGASDHPPSSELTTANVAHVIHQVVQALRTSVNGKHFGWVQGVGHSMGALAVGYEAATYGDLDSVILTGMAHTLSPSGVIGIQSTLYPANLETPWSTLDSGYLTTRPGTRSTYFYHPPTTAAGVVAHDEATKDTVPVAELLDLSLYDQTVDIDVPVLVVNGEFDALICATDGMDCSTSAAVQAAEDPYFSTAACMRAISVPNTAHDLQLHRTVLLSNALMLGWTHLVTGGRSGGGPGCTAVLARWTTTQAPIMRQAPLFMSAASD